jgi:hypothetical protein
LHEYRLGPVGNSLTGRKPSHPVQNLPPGASGTRSFFTIILNTKTHLSDLNTSVTINAKPVNLEASAFARIKKLVEELSIDVVISAGVPSLHQNPTLWSCEY